jgi:hypothetical protein
MLSENVSWWCLVKKLLEVSLDSVSWKWLLKVLIGSVS